MIDFSSGDMKEHMTWTFLQIDFVWINLILKVSQRNVRKNANKAKTTDWVMFEWIKKITSRPNLIILNEKDVNKNDRCNYKDGKMLLKW